jgi:hypothetical protein
MMGDGHKFECTCQCKNIPRLGLQAHIQQYGGHNMMGEGFAFFRWHYLTCGYGTYCPGYKTDCGRLWEMIQQYGGHKWLWLK